MVKVLVVDDEPFVRQGLKSIIDWNEYGFELCGEAENGLAALEAIEAHQPHLVITDIKMPGLDGLELIRKATYELKCTSKFIILTGYEDFNYAKTAIKYNVKGYILKPVEESELIDILNRIREEIDLESMNEKQHYASIKALAAETVKKLIQGEASSEDMVYSKQWLGIYEEDQLWYITIDVEDCEQKLENMDEVDVPGVYKELEDIIYNSVGKENSLNIYRENIWRYGIVVNKNIVQKVNGTINGLTDRIYKNLAKSGKFVITVFIGTEVKSASELKQSFDTCHDAMNYLHLYPDRDIIFYDEVKHTPFSYDLKNIQYFTELQEDIENNRQEQIASSVDKIFKEMQDNHMAPEVIKACIIKFELETVRIISDMSGDTGEIFKKNMMANLKVSRMDTVKSNFIKFCTECARYYKSLKEKKSCGIIYEIEKYVHRNYKNEISLKSISEIFYINPVYLGQLFKKNFGLYFSEYLNNLRIEEAMKLLRRTDYRIYEIAQMVGYPDTNYFISKFEKHCSMTPTQYKKCGTQA